MFSIVILRDSNLGDYLKDQLLSKKIHQLDGKLKTHIKQELFAFYVFGTKLGQQKIVYNSYASKFDNKSSVAEKIYLEAHGLNEHVIVMSLTEMLNKNYLSLALVNMGLGDSTVIVLNQILFTFYKQGMIVSEAMSIEQWYWRSSDY